MQAGGGQNSSSSPTSRLRETLQFVSLIRSEEVEIRRHRQSQGSRGPGSLLQ
jgi:hypothetical protein